MSAILIHSGAVLTADGWLDPGYVFINGEAVEVVAGGAPPARLSDRATTIIDAQHKAVLPGLVNGHTHFSQTFMRGLAGGRPLLTWLKELIWPLQKALTPEDMRLAALLGLVENLRCGVTTVVDHHKVAYTSQHSDVVLEAAEQVGLRLVLARSWADLGTNAESQESILTDLERLFKVWQAHQRISIANGPLVPWRCSNDMLVKTHGLAQRYNAPTHIHVSETQAEVDMTVEATGKTPILWMDALGVMGLDVQIVHAVWIDEVEIDVLAERAAMVVHCPVSNAVLGSGIAPLAALHEAGLRIRLGTDGPASNDTQDIFETLKMALNLSRVATLDPTKPTPEQALAMALDNRVLAPEAPADVVVVNLNHPRAVPVHDYASALTLSTHGSDVDTVIVAGEMLMHDSQILVLDEEQLFDQCRAAVAGLREKAGLESTTA